MPMGFTSRSIGSRPMKTPWIWSLSSLLWQRPFTTTCLEMERLPALSTLRKIGHTISQKWLSIKIQCSPSWWGFTLPFTGNGSTGKLPTRGNIKPWMFVKYYLGQYLYIFPFKWSWGWQRFRTRNSPGWLSFIRSILVLCSWNVWYAPQSYTYLIIRWLVGTNVYWYTGCLHAIQLTYLFFSYIYSWLF